MPDRDEYIKVLKKIVKAKKKYYPDDENMTIKISYQAVVDILALLKEQEEQKQKWLQNIADNQLANSPDEWQSPEQRMYSKGVFDGLQMTYEMLAYGVVKRDA